MKDYSLKFYGAALVLLLVAAFGCKRTVQERQFEFKATNYFPNSGKAGTLITIEGQGFDTDIRNYSASVSGAAAEVVSATSSFLVVRSPAGATSGKLNVSYRGKGYEIGQYIYQALSVQHISPTRGPAGANIRIRGEGFGSVGQPAKVSVNGNAATIISLTDTLIIVTVPAKTASGPVTVTVDGQSSSGPVFKVMVMGDLSPATGGKGTKVLVKGSGFDTDVSKNQVFFNGKAAQVLEAKEEQLTVLAPDGVETGNLTATIDGVSLPGPVFTVVPPPTISVVSPMSGPAGTEMTITGAGFSEIAGETKVMINDKEIVLTSVTKTVIKLIIPGNTGTGKVKVVVNDQAAEGPTFTDQALGIFQTDPEGGVPGTEVTIFGTGFSVTPSDNQVFFNGVAAAVASSSATELKVKVPAGATTGTIKVQVNGKEAVAPKIFAIEGVYSLTTSLSANVSAITVGLNGEIYATDPVLHQVLKISTSGAVALFAGSPGGQSGNQDGAGTSATFNSPVGITADRHGNLFVVESAGNVRKITPGGMVSTFKTAVVFAGGAIASDGNNNLYVMGLPNNFSGITKISPAGDIQYLFDFFDPENRVGIDAAGIVYASDNNATGKSAIGIGSGDRRIGSSPGFADGDYGTALFAEVHSILVNSKNQLLVADYGNNALRSVDLGSKTVTTIFKADKGFADGPMGVVRFGELTDLALGNGDRLYILDRVNRAIRVVVY